jgi:hypothetical protein
MIWAFPSLTLAVRYRRCAKVPIAHSRADAQPIVLLEGLGAVDGYPRSHPMRRRIALFCLPLAALSGMLTPAVAADLDGPLYSQRNVVIERPASAIVRERIIERNYYYEEPSYPLQAYAPTYYYYAPRTYGGSAYEDGYHWYPRRPFFAVRQGWHPRHRHWRY